MHEPVSVEKFLGMYTRGIADAVPRGYFIDSLNVKFSENDVFTRDGSTKVLTDSNIVRFFMYKRINETPRIIYLNTSGQLFDSLYPGTPIWTDATYLDFSMVNFNNRAYISPHNRVTGISGKILLVYDGSGVARPAGGDAPTGFTLGAVESATSGTCEAGTHIIAVCFESESGYITNPGPALFAVAVSTGNKKIDLSALPALPAGMTAVQVIATKAIQSYNGNQEGYQFYFVPSANGGRITGGASTGALSFYDIELIEDATYLFETRGRIPAGVGIGEYSGRMMIWGVPGGEHTIIMSERDEPENFHEIDGDSVVNPFDNSSGIKNCFSFRNNLISCKSNRMYVTSDNGSEPSTWKWDDLDMGAGTECFGVSTIADSKGQQADRAFIADRSGLLLIEGYVRRPEGSWLIEDTWKRITKSVFNLIQVCVDTTGSSIYITVPLDGATSITHIIYGYYGNAYGPFGFDPKQIKWSLWTMQPGTKSIAVDVNSSKEVVFKYAGSSGNIYDMKSDYSVHADDGNAFESYVKLGLFTVLSGWINHCGPLQLRVTGSGTLLTTLQGIDESNSQSLANITMAATPGMERELKANFKNERVSPKFRTGVNVNEYFKLTRVDIHLKPLWKARSA